MRVLRLLSIACGLVYLITQPWHPFPGSFAIKGLSIAALGLLAFLSSSKNRDAIILGVALMLSSIGDVLLDLDPQGLFVYGLGSFLIVHLIYVFLFVRYWPKPPRIRIAQAVALLLVLAYSATMSGWLMPSLGNLTVPVAIYMCAITAMVVAAILARVPAPWVLVGAVLFLISDSLLAVNKFKTPIPYRDYLVWATYYVGQYCIASGILGREAGAAIRRAEPLPG